MAKLIKHKWNPVPGRWKTWVCVHCGATKRWDSEHECCVYYTKFRGPYFRVPECKRTFLGDKVNLDEIGTDWNNGEFYK